MYKNYFYLNRYVLELNEALCDYSLIEAFSQEKDQLILTFYNGTDTRHLIVSVAQNDPYINQRREFHRAKKNTADFFGEYLPSLISKVEIAVDDRIIRFNFDRFSIFFTIRGKDTNILLADEDGNVSSFKKTTDEMKYRVNDELQRNVYSPYFHRPDLDIITEPDYLRIIKAEFPFIGREILSETSFRTGSNELEEYLRHLNEVIDEVENGNITVFFDSSSGKIVMAPSSFHIFDQQEEQEFNSYTEALNNYLIRKYQTQSIVEMRKTVSKNLDQQIAKVSRKLDEVLFRLNEPSKEEFYRDCGNLLLANIHLIRKGMEKIEVENYYNNNELVSIILDTKKDAKGNIDRYFEKAKNDRQSKIVLEKLQSSLKKQLSELQQKKFSFENANKIEEYRKIMSDLHIKENQGENYHREENFNFKHYIIENKYHVYVGKDSKNNDLLTVKFAKQNDYWFHARGVPGSHVVLRVENTKEPVPKPVLKKAASLAAYHSKAKTSKMAPVSYTLKKYVTKKKGMEPGKVSMMKEEVLLVQPEIPSECEFITD
ncbi:MAG: NFACT RNA binding domain-containing protein [Ignavibacteriales bacterium]